MRYFVAGGGAYGTHYLRKLRIAVAKRKLALDEIVVVDRDPSCRAVAEIASMPIARLHTAEWADFGREVWARRDAWAGDIWVPAPIAPHILSDWILARLARDHSLSAAPVLDGVGLPDIPYARALDDGRILLSHAPGLCPLGCIEPGTCAITNDTRWWEMRNTIETLIAASPESHRIGAVAMFFCKHHCDAGEYDVGGIRMSTIYEEADRVCAAARPGARIGVATFSSCHGVLNLFDLRAAPAVRPCVRCGAEFTCGATSTAAECWCAGLPRVMPAAGSSACYCPVCLPVAISARSSDRTAPR